MKNFFEWCQEKGLSLEAVHKEPVRSGKKVKGKLGDKHGSVHKQVDDLEDYKGDWEMNGTVDPMELKGKSGGKSAADVAK